ncbi:hypothetical protein K1T71_008420 [Dendrolimus kikuchii]|uniref:Uncharacterized protein n=1 Tax=Dendrolimus kikuchii TaxID=765133 RepID=A0ACC1CXD5_9NEOP|nr:hypothetical protein K1T71_008420 [Dendrolimus kikuchii]
MEDLKKLRAARGYFVSHIKQCLGALKNLNIRTDTWNPILLAVLYRKLDSYSLMAYQLDRNATVDSTVAEFLSYLDKRALALEYVQSSSSSDRIHNPKVAINMTTTFGSRSCLYCNVAAV